VRPAALGALTGEGGDDVPDVDGPAESPVRLDPVAGHGSFIAGVIKAIEPQALVRNIKLVGPCGDVDERTLADRIRSLATDEEPHPHVLNLSIAGYGADRMADLDFAIGELRERGTVVVAAAGNDRTCRPTYPAAIDGVIGVGAVDRDGRPAPFTNFGDWVVACAHGVDVTSTFFEWDGEDVDAAGRDVDDFPGLAVWSGTSFAAPVVAGLIARELVAARLQGDQLGAEDAAAAVLASGAPIANLGVHVEA
jgi:subtilisin family serine protease